MVTDGRVIYGDWSLLCANATQGSAYSAFVFTVSNITDDAWNYNMNVGSGAMSLSINSTFIAQTSKQGANGFLLETGPVTDQSFAGGSATGTPSFYAGGGDYSTLFSASAKSTVSLTPDGEGAYQMVSVGFGKVQIDSQTALPTAGFWQPLGYPMQRQDAIIATNFKGLGLPYYLWFQVTNLLYKVDASFDSDLTCDYSVGGMCKLANPCSSYTNLWSAGWSFNFMFQGAVDYVLVPLGALAEEDTTNNVCNIHIQFLNDNKHSQSGQVVLGSMFLQMFKNYVQYDLATFVTTYQLQLSDSCTLNDAYIGSASLSELSNPFRLLYGAAEQIFVNTDEYEYKTTIGG
jgi:hypothetical protein